jgi:hypothetical protein
VSNHFHTKNSRNFANQPCATCKNANLTGGVGARKPFARHASNVYLRVAENIG